MVKVRFPKQLLVVLDKNGAPHIIASMTNLTDDKLLSSDLRVARYGLLGIEPEKDDHEE